jgi:hypothetical protein
MYHLGGAFAQAKGVAKDRRMAVSMLAKAVAIMEGRQGTVESNPRYLAAMRNSLRIARENLARHEGDAAADAAERKWQEDEARRREQYDVLSAPR